MPKVSVEGIPRDNLENVSFTGTRHFPASAREKLYERLGELRPKWHRLIVGGCVGLDTEIALWGIGHGFQVHAVIPRDRGMVDPLWREHCTSYELMEPISSYRERNQRLVELASRTLIAVPEWPEKHPRSARSGTWQTVRMAQRRKLRIELLILNR